MYIKVCALASVCLSAVRLDSNYYETCHRCELGGTSTALVSQLAQNIIIIIIIIITTFCNIDDYDRY